MAGRAGTGWGWVSSILLQTIGLIWKSGRAVRGMEAICGTLGTTKIGKYFHTGNMGFPQEGRIREAGNFKVAFKEPEVRSAWAGSSLNE
jgi:hypothetical protein